MPNTKISGAWTALITPFLENESIDWAALENLIENQIQAGISGLLINGTTGESPTIEENELKNLIKFSKEKINNRVPLMVGIGTNSTKKSIEKARLAYDLGADFLLVVNPYYNKPTQEGLYLHFKAVAEATPLPNILYNIKPRTSVNLETETLLRLINDVPNIIAVKEASGDIAQIKAVSEQAPKDFTVLSGDDNLTYKIMRDYSVAGVISVVSNLIPEKIVELVKLCLNKKFEEAEILDNYLEPIINGAFLETNPIPIKAALTMQGKIKEIYRLPMCKMSKDKKQEWREILEKNNLI